MFLSSLSPPPNSLPCYTTIPLAEREEGGGADVIAMAMDDNTVQAFTTDVSQCNTVQSKNFFEQKFCSTLEL